MYLQGKFLEAGWLGQNRRAQMMPDSSYITSQNSFKENLKQYQHFNLNFSDKVWAKTFLSV